MKLLVEPSNKEFSYNSEEICATSKIVSYLTILLVLVAWFYKIYILLAIGISISIISLLIITATALISIWK